jgi:hypothetical protein
MLYALMRNIDGTLKAMIDSSRLFRNPLDARATKAADEKLYEIFLALGYHDSKDESISNAIPHHSPHVLSIRDPMLIETFHYSDRLFGNIQGAFNENARIVDFLKKTNSRYSLCKQTGLPLGKVNLRAAQRITDINDKDRGQQIYSADMGVISPLKW